MWEWGWALLTLSVVSMIIAVSALLLAGFAKGISGMGLPVVATPILTVLLDLQTAIAITIVSTVVTDVLMLVRLPKDWRLIKKASLLIVFGVCGIIIGSIFLMRINPFILSGILGIIVIIFVVTSFFSLLPSFKQLPWLDAIIGVIAGMVQGAAGACGPIISMHLMQMKMNRNEFLFMINSFFVIIDITQFIAIYQLGLYTGKITFFSLAALVPTLLALTAAFFLQKWVSDQLFRYSVLLIMALSGVVLLSKSTHLFSS